MTGKADRLKSVFFRDDYVGGDGGHAGGDLVVPAPREKALDGDILLAGERQFDSPGLPNRQALYPVVGPLGLDPVEFPGDQVDTDLKGRTGDLPEKPVHHLGRSRVTSLR